LRLVPRPAFCPVRLGLVARRLIVLDAAVGVVSTHEHVLRRRVVHRSVGVEAQDLDARPRRHEIETDTRLGLFAGSFHHGSVLRLRDHAAQENGVPGGFPGRRAGEHDAVREGLSQSGLIIRRIDDPAHDHPGTQVGQAQNREVDAREVEYLSGGVSCMFRMCCVLRHCISKLV
jgi:hypothetical protein